MEKCQSCPFRSFDSPCYAQSINNPRLCELAAADADYLVFVRDKSRELMEAAVEPQQVGALSKVGNFVGAVVTQVVAGYPVASQAVQDDRLGICQGCEQYDPSKDGCRHCGCGQTKAIVAVGIDLALKRSWATAKCPLDKWGAVEPAE